MNTFYEHHHDSIRFGYRCFDRVLLNGLIQPFQQPERVVGFFKAYRELYPVSKYVLRDIAQQYQHWVTARSTEWGGPSSVRRTSSAGINSSRTFDAQTRTAWWSS
jgi:hypothetical protein